MVFLGNFSEGEEMTSIAVILSLFFFGCAHERPPDCDFVCLDLDKIPESCICRNEVQKIPRGFK